MGIVKWLRGERVLYYPGCFTKNVLKKQFENYKEIFNRLGINFILLSDEEVCCGLPVLNAGYKKDARKLAEKNFDIFKKNKVVKIITSCPAGYYMFKQVYPTLVRGWNIEVEHATITILNALKKKKIKYKGDSSKREVVGYNDPCYLGIRSGIYEEPREVIELVGGKILELSSNRENAICCGASGGIYKNFPKISKSIAREKVAEIKNKVNKIISPCGLCYTTIKSVTEKSVEFSDFVLEKLRGMNIK